MGAPRTEKTNTAWSRQGVQVLHKALAQALKWNMIPRNAADAVKAPRPTPAEIRPLDQKQAKALLEAARTDPFEALYVLAVTTGMRQGELLCLKWEDVDLENGLIWVRRTLTRDGTAQLFASRTHVLTASKGRGSGLARSGDRVSAL